MFGICVRWDRKECGPCELPCVQGLFKGVWDEWLSVPTSEGLMNTFCQVWDLVGLVPMLGITDVSAGVLVAWNAQCCSAVIG